MLKHLNNSQILPKRVVVMGAAGFVGSAVCKQLQENNVEVLPLSRAQVDLLHDNAAYDLQECLQEGDALVVVSAIAPCKNYDQMFANIQMMRSVCEAIKNSKLSHVVYISSDAVYGSGLAKTDEESRAEPDSFHGMMHLARELMLKSVVGTTPLAVFRPSVLYGKNDPHNSYGPNKFFRLAKDNQDITLFGHGEEKRDHVYIDDVAKLVTLALLHRSSGLLNIVTGTSTSFHDVAVLVKEALGSKSNIVPTERKNPITHSHFDITACLKAFPGFKYTDLKTGLKLIK